ncbi:sulfotransferase, partial [Candidatus Woesearchaeota archaeon]
MSSKLPNFIVVGAQKSGTTSIYNYLRQHPEVYLPDRKECWFLSEAKPGKIPGDVTEKDMVRTIEQYRKLFSKVKNEKAIGEVSPDYLFYHKNTIKNIKKYFPKPEKVKIIIILRNPVDRAYSAYYHLRREGREKLPFEDAIKKEKERIKKGAGLGWRYTQMGFYYEQVKDFIENFPETRVYLFEDFKKDPAGIMKDILKFIGVNPDFEIDYSVKYNISGEVRSRALRTITEAVFRSKTIQKIAPAIYRIAGE